MLGFGLGGLTVLGLGVVGYVGFVSSSMLNATHEVAPVDIPVPWKGETLGSDKLGIVDKLREQAALVRGEKLAVRLGCTECHGPDLGGKVVMDVGPVMTLAAPNLTQLPDTYGIGDFERIVRHGVRRDGGTSFMPAIDYQALADREVSDLFVYVQDQPTVERNVKPSQWGPVMRTLYAFGQVPALSAHRIDPQRDNLRKPPPKRNDATYGEHLAQTCVSCHNDRFTGGPMRDGDPEWPPAANLTSHADGLASWSEDDFLKLMKTGIRPDGTTVDPVAMPWRTLGTADDVQLQALFTYFRTLPAKPTGQ